MPAKTILVTPTISIPMREIELSFSRSPGPGGQNVNKVNSKVTLAWNLASSKSVSEEVKERLQARFANRINREGWLIIHSHRYRDQLKNQDDCSSKLAEFVRECSVPPKKRKKTKPTGASKFRRLDNKKKTSDKKQLRSKRVAE